MNRAVRGTGQQDSTQLGGMDVLVESVEFDEWVSPHLITLRAIAIREVGAANADDVVQDTLVRAWRRRSTYRADRGSVKTWLVALLLDQARRRRVRDWRSRIKPGVGVVALVEVGPSSRERLDIEAAVRGLPRRQREVVTLFYLADLSVAEVATVLGISAGSVKRHLSAARATLSTTLEQ